MRSWNDLRNYSTLIEDGREIARCDIAESGFWTWETKSPKQFGMAVGRDGAKKAVEAKLSASEAA